MQSSEHCVKVEESEIYSSYSEPLKGQVHFRRDLSLPKKNHVAQASTSRSANVAGRKSNNENNKRLVSWCLTGATMYKTVSLKKNGVLKEQKTEGQSCSYQVYGSISVYASLEPKREVKDGYLSSQYNQGFQALGTSEIARRARTCPLFIMENSLQGSSHTPSIKNPCIQAKYRHCNLVQEGLSSQLHRCHGY